MPDHRATIDAWPMAAHMKPPADAPVTMIEEALLRSIPVWVVLNCRTVDCSPGGISALLLKTATPPGSEGEARTFAGSSIRSQSAWRLRAPRLQTWAEQPL